MTPIIPSLLVRLRPSTPWRIGPDSGARDQAASVLHSDALYSAVTGAMAQLGWLDEWLTATAREGAEPAVRFSSAFPFQRGTLFVPPPAGLWPPHPASTAQPARVRWKGAGFVSTRLLGPLLRGEEPNEENWAVDGHSGCLLPVASRQVTGPFRLLHRSFAAVDRPSGGVVAPHSSTCLQFAPGSGLWCAVQFSNQNAYAVWSPKLEAAFRLLADSGIGGLRSRGFGRARTPEFQAGPLAELLGIESLGLDMRGQNAGAGSSAYWLLSLFSPSAQDSVDWQAGHYSLLVRTGRTAEAAGGGLKRASRLVKEGSVLLAAAPPVGTVQNVAPEGAAHPIYRAGYAFSVPIPWRVSA